MVSKEMKAAIEGLNKYTDIMRFQDGATEEQISKFEKEQGITLSKQFKEWLSFSDGGEFFLPGGFQLYGVAHKPFIDIANKDRPDERFVVIGALSFGDPILMEKSTERIAVYNHEARTIEDDEMYQDFFSFLSSISEDLAPEE